MGQFRDFLLPQYHDYREFTKVNPDLKIKTRDAGRTIKRVIFHCTDATNWTPQRLSEFFVNERKFPICSYHYYVQGKVVWHMTGDNVITYHAANHNSDTVAFSIDYNATRYEKLNIAIEPEVYQNAINTAAFLLLKYKLTPDKLFGHRELSFTGFWVDQNDIKHLRKTCPGMAVNLDKFRYEVTRRMQETINNFAAVNEKVTVDGICGPKTVYAIENYFLNVD